MIVNKEDSPWGKDNKVKAVDNLKRIGTTMTGVGGEGVSNDINVPDEAIEFAIPLIKRELFALVEYWGIVVTNSALYLFRMPPNFAATAPGLLIGGLIDGVVGEKHKSNVVKAKESGVKEVLSLAEEWHRLVPSILSDIRIKRGVTRFIVKFPDLNGRKKLSLSIWNKYHSGLVGSLDKLKHC